MPCDSGRCGPNGEDCPYEWHPYSQALSGLPDDIAETAWNLLAGLGRPWYSYRLPLLVTGRYDSLQSGLVPFTFSFPTIGVIFGISQRTRFTNVADDILDLNIVVADESSNRTLIGATSQAFSLAAIPDAQNSGLDKLRVSPMSCYPETDWETEISVVAGTALTGTARGAVNLLGIGFWESGSNITSRQGVGNPDPQGAIGVTHGRPYAR